MQKATAELVLAEIEKDHSVSVAEVARRLGVSRQRIFQVAKKHGIQFKKYQWPTDYTPRRHALPPEAKTPILVGGAVNHTVCGVISEQMVAADLLIRGFKVYTPIVRQRSHDLIAVDQRGATLTIEVRSAKRNADGALHASLPSKMTSQYLALVANGERIIYRPELPQAESPPVHVP